MTAQVTVTIIMFMKSIAKEFIGPGVLEGKNSAYLNALINPIHVYMHLVTLRELFIRKGYLTPVGSGLGERVKCSFFFPIPTLLLCFFIKFLYPKKFSHHRSPLSYSVWKLQIL